MTEVERIAEVDKAGLQFEQFIIAVNGALIAYATTKLELQSLNYYIIPLILAILCWLISFYFGIKSTRSLLSARITGIFKDRPEIKSNPEFLKIAKGAFNKIAVTANKSSGRMYWCLYTGGLFFIIWEFINLFTKK